jgi:prepilin-type N-terminal cleavage/methylation domain-containing protein
VLNVIKRREQRGFTLIELIAVLVVLTILVALAMPKYFSIQDEARKKAAQTALAAGEKRVITAYTESDVSMRAVDITERTLTGVQRHP